jgi:hypothetical protein
VTPADLMAFRLEDGPTVVQIEAGGAETSFDPRDWGAFTRGSLVVHAVRIPRPFKLGAELCKDAYLVYDGRLKAISAATFGLDYEPLARAA